MNFQRYQHFCSKVFKTYSLYDLFKLFVFVGWDEGVLGMQLGEVARLRVYYLFLVIYLQQLVVAYVRLDLLIFELIY